MKKPQLYIVPHDEEICSASSFSSARRLPPADGGVRVGETVAIAAHVVARQRIPHMPEGEGPNNASFIEALYLAVVDAETGEEVFFHAPLDEALCVLPGSPGGRHALFQCPSCGKKN